MRGRHRGLPVAVDRAVVLPSELVTQTHDAKGKPQQTHGQRMSHESRYENILSPVMENGVGTVMEMADQDLSNVETLNENEIE